MKITTYGRIRFSLNEPIGLRTRIQQQAYTTIRTAPPTQGLRADDVAEVGVQAREHHTHLLEVPPGGRQHIEQQEQTFWGAPSNGRIQATTIQDIW